MTYERMWYILTNTPSCLVVGGYQGQSIFGFYFAAH